MAHRTNNPYARAPGSVTPPPEPAVAQHSPAAAPFDYHGAASAAPHPHSATAAAAAAYQPTAAHYDGASAHAGGGGGNGAASAPATSGALAVPAEVFEATLHKPLAGYVSFVPYPKTAVQFAPEAPAVPDELYQRIFIGQLPYGVTEMQLQWMAQLFGGGVVLRAPEVIIKGGKKTGCVHALVRDAQLKQLVAGMHKRLLVDDTGVWVGRSADEIQILTQYVGELKSDPKKRYPDRPYDTVVVQNATSERQQHHQGLPTIDEFFAAQNGTYG